MRFAMRCQVRVCVGVTWVALAASPTLAHVAPAARENNRYIKVLPLGDRVRVAYTVFYGEAPGHTMRQALDVDHDGIVSDSEAHAYGEQLAAKVAAGLELEVDGVRWPVAWDEISVGLGMPQTSAGAWSVDLIASPCSAGAGGVHRLVMKDRTELELAGETEVWVVDAPGVTIDRARIGAMDDPTHDFQFSGPSRELAKDGLDLTYRATGAGRLGRGSGRACSAGGVGDGDGDSRSWLPWVVAVASGGLIGLAAMVVQRRRRRGS